MQNKLNAFETLKWYMNEYEQDSNSALLNGYFTRWVSHIFQRMKFPLVAPVKEQKSQSQGENHREEHQKNKWVSCNIKEKQLN